MVTKITIVDKTVGEKHEYTYTDRYSLHCLVDAINCFVEMLNYEEGHEYDINVREGER